MSSLDTRIAEILANRKRLALEPRNLVRAAVLVPLLRNADEYYLLFTKRPKELKNHPGQISFPGGGFEAQDITLKGTVLRELLEELGVLKNDIQFLGELDDYESTTGFLITPFVGRIPYPYDFKINRREVSELVFAPVSELRKPPRVGYVVRHGKPCSVYYYDLPQRVIWGATARIIKNLVEAVFVNQTHTS